MDLRLDPVNRCAHLVLAVRNDILQPLLVARHGVARQRRQLHALRLQLLVLERQPPDLRRAHRLQRQYAQTVSDLQLEALFARGKLTLYRMENENSDSLGVQVQRELMVWSLYQVLL